MYLYFPVFFSEVPVIDDVEELLEALGGPKKVGYPSK